jgi:hypothetical protein
MTASCIEPYANCNGMLVDGCEVNKDIDADHCGACGASCENPHGGRHCDSGICKPTCDSGWGACGDPAAGCTFDVSSDPQNCGTCGHVCKGGNCVAGKCECDDMQPARDTACNFTMKCGPYWYLADVPCYCFCINNLITCRFNDSDGAGCSPAMP